VLVVAGLTAVLVGLVPRLSALAWILGARAAAEDLDVVPLIGLAVGAGALAAVALTAFRRRHLTA
jgi:putative exporter of polyketide antibiotics